MSEEISRPDTLASIIADAVREGLSRTLTPQPHSSQISFRPGESAASGNSVSLYQRVSAISSLSRQPSQPSTTHTPRSALSQSSSAVRKRYATPSMFLSKRSRKDDQAQPKSVTYVRDILCLPQECQGRSGAVVIPRGWNRRRLINEDVGLLGNMEFQSTWSAERMRQEICSVFATPFGQSQEAIEEGQKFPFDYLQHTGAGSRTLCVPAVSPTFEWNGRQVATLAKSGGCYILAHGDIPALKAKMQDESSNNLSDHSPDRTSSPSQVLPCSPLSDTHVEENRVIVSSDDEDHSSTYLSLASQQRCTSRSLISQPSASSSRPSIHDAVTSSVQMVEMSSVSERASDSSMDGEEYEQSKSPCPLDKLLNMFVGLFRAKQVMAMYCASGGNLIAASSAFWQVLHFRPSSPFSTITSRSKHM